MKAFDRVSHEFLFSVLEIFGFGTSFMKQIKLLYFNITSSVIVNNHVTDAFAVTMGGPPCVSTLPAPVCVMH